MSSLMWMPQMFSHLIIGKKMGENNYVRHSGKTNEPAVFASCHLLKSKLKYPNNKAVIRERLLLLS